MDDGCLANLSLLEEMYGRYLADPSKVDKKWQVFFEGTEFGERAEPVISDEKRVRDLIESYRRFGHLQANINPISPKKGEVVVELSLNALGFEENELDRFFSTLGLLEKAEAPLRSIISALEEIYCSTIGAEYVSSRKIDRWIQEELEGKKVHFGPEQKKQLLQQLVQAELFEQFLSRKYVGQKRFSLEGGETLIPMLREIIDLGADSGIDEWVLGMAHRGRLNVRANVMYEPLSSLFSEFEDYYDPDLMEIAGDVKYHKGFSADIVTEQGHKIHLALTANPSHLESVNPVVLGKVRAKQSQRGENKVAPIMIHGDGSMAGQGVVYETLQLGGLANYSVGGTIHIVVNNQIGFTTLPSEGRSTRYCSDVAKGFEMPIFHVNGEDPEACLYVARLALQLRQKFHCDVLIDLNCYRKYGHNESDEPSFTQPLEYRQIREKKSIAELYRNRLMQAGIVEEEEDFLAELKKGFDEAQSQQKVEVEKPFRGVWENYRKASGSEWCQEIKTSVDKSLLQDLVHRFCQIPEGFALHPKIQKLQETRLKRIETGSEVDWALAEQLAFGSLLFEGTRVRLVGQDSQRGTFSQRHVVWVDQENGKKYFPLNHLKEDQGLFEAVNSPLSELAALGFEYGFTLCYPSALVVWEAQFGDFANGAQVVIDQYLSSSEEKWNRCSGLVLLLPHGYEGQGSEHSSARLERFLQLAGNENMRIVYPTTPAQYFHLLRRQILCPTRKPLIILTPKGLLRNSRCVSSLDQFVSAGFEPFLDDLQVKDRVSRLLLCSGRIYYDLAKERERLETEEVAIVRLEQLYPLNEEKLARLLERYSDVPEVYWVQEEPKNMGAWSYISPILDKLLRKKINFVGRPLSSSPATGSHAVHKKEQELVLKSAFEGLAK